MGFSDDLSEFLDPFLHLKIHNKVWDIPTANAVDGIRIKQLMLIGGMTADDETREALRLLGAEWVTEDVTIPVMHDPTTGKLMQTQLTDDEGKPVFRDAVIGKWTGGLYDEMSAFGISHEEIEIAAATLLSHTVFGLEAAENYWDSRRGAQQPKPELDEPAGNPEPPKAGANRTTRRAAKKAPAKKATKKATSSKASTASTTPVRARTAKPTPAGRTTTR